MKIFLRPAAIAALLLILSLSSLHAAGRFEKALSPDQRILHALNRLTFGPRPGDIEEVRRIGLDKWIALQLHPEQIAESATLEARLKPLETLTMDTAAIMKDYSPIRMNAPVPMAPPLPPDQMRTLRTGTKEQREELLSKLDPPTRSQALSMVPAVLFEDSPSLQKEAEAARSATQTAMMQQIRQRNPPLGDLLNPDQLNTALRGNPAQIADLFAYFGPAKRAQIAGALPAQALADLPELRREGMRQRQPMQVPLDDLKQGRVFRAIYSNRQLEEVLVDFWLNHFNVYENKGQVRQVLTSYERDAIRPHVLGHFKDLLLATAQHPAMLYYLDNFESAAPEGRKEPLPPGASLPNVALIRRSRGLNENYGRELMELHTLGVKGGYTQDDVIAVARCFTGWTVETLPAAPDYRFAAYMHDNGEKVVLGHQIAPDGGEKDGLDVIDILVHHPATAKFISRELAQRFVADDPPQSLVDRMAKTFTDTDGDLRAVMAAMFSAPEFFSEGAWQGKVKSPLELVASAVRAAGAEVNDTYTLVQRVGDLSEPLYGKVEPNGYSDAAEAWLNTAGLLGRLNFSATLASGQMPGVKWNASRFEGKDAAAIARELLGVNPSPQTIAAIEKSETATSGFIAGLVIGSPEFQKK